MDLFLVFLTHLWIFTYFECHSRFHSILLWYWFMLCWNDHEWSLQDVEDFPAMGPQTSPIIAIADPISKFFGIWIFWMMQHQLRCCCNIFWFIRVCSKFFHNLCLVFFPLKGGPPNYDSGYHCLLCEGNTLGQSGICLSTTRRTPQVGAVGAYGPELESPQCHSQNPRIWPGIVGNPTRNHPSNQTFRGHFTSSQIGRHTQ